MDNQHVVIAARFRGPPHSGNGGYSAGLLAERFEGPCEVTLRAPPPLDTALLLSRADGRVVLQHRDRLIAEARAGEVELEVPECLSFEAAARASQNYIGFTSHPYSSCFVCGPSCAPGEGLAIYPGAVAGRRVVAAPWQPARELCRDGENVDTRYVWAALDCPGWFGFSTFAAESPATLLGRLALDIKRRPRAEERCVVLGWHTSREGRRIACAALLQGEDGSCIALAKSTWIALKPTS